MPFQLQITVDTIEDAERILACLRHDAAPAAVQVAEQVTTGKRGPGRPRRTIAEPAAPAPAPESAAQSAPVQAATSLEADTSAQQTPTFDDAKAALQTLLQKYDGDMTKPLAVLAKYKAQRISAVNETDWKAFIADCEAA